MLVLILAAGKGTRMKSELPKVLHNAAGKPMLWYSIDLAKKLKPEKIITIVGSGSALVRDTFKESGVEFYEQKAQLGTADAVLAARKALESYNGKVLILSGDMPCLKYETVQKFTEEMTGDQPAFISVKVSTPKGYGRVLRTVGKELLKIVEEKDANVNEKRITEINTGIYCCDASELLKRLDAVENNNAQHEYYLTDIISTGSIAWLAEDQKEFIGVNDRVQLAEASKTLWKRRAEKWMGEGVGIIDPDSVYISPESEIAPDVTIWPNVYIEGASQIASGCELRHGVRIVSSVIGKDTVIKDNTLIEESIVGDKCTLGPMAHLRPHSVLKGSNAIGNFTEIKKSILGEGTKANHLTYIGDAEVGSGTNIGCGTITCNYDGFHKHKTVIGSGVFVGSDTQFVAPVTVGDNAIIGAGSTITDDVPADALALSRTTQKNMEGKAVSIRQIKSKS